MKKILILTILLALPIWSWAQSERDITTQSMFLDGFFYSSAADNNYGADVTTRVTSSRSTIFALNGTWIDSIGAGQTVDSIVCSLKVAGFGGADDTLRAYPIWKSDCMVEGAGTISVPTTTGMSYNDWNGPNSEWGAAGCASAADGSSYNCTDAGGYDRMTTPCDSLAGVTTYNFYKIRLPGSYCQSMYSAGRAVAFLLTGNGALANTDFHTREAASASNRPRVTIFYHVAAEPPAAGSNTVLRGSVIQGSVIR